MNYGMQLSASGVLTSMYRQDVLSNNLANVDTIGFRHDIVGLTQRDPARIEDALFAMPSNQMLERLGGGVLVAPNRVSTSQGSLDSTGNPLHLAIEGDGYFVVSTGTGSDQERLRLTRDGRLAQDSTGRLVTATDGLPILDTANRPIQLSRAVPFEVDSNGSVRQNGSVVARIQLTSIPNPGDSLQKAGGNLFTVSASVLSSRRPATGNVVQGVVERSTVDPIKAVMGVQSAAGGVSSNARMIQLFDDLLNRAINTFGRVA